MVVVARYSLLLVWDRHNLQVVPFLLPIQWSNPFSTFQPEAIIRLYQGHLAFQALHQQIPYRHALTQQASQSPVAHLQLGYTQQLLYGFAQFPTNDGIASFIRIENTSPSWIAYLVVGHYQH